METLKKLFIAVLIFLTMVFYLPRITFAQEVHLEAKAVITEHAPKSRTTQPKDILTVKEKKTPIWQYLILLVLLGAVAGLAGGGGGGGGGDGDTGSITATW